jgi:hypothetical protein
MITSGGGIASSRYFRKEIESIINIASSMTKKTTERSGAYVDFEQAQNS